MRFINGKPTKMQMRNGNPGLARVERRVMSNMMDETERLRLTQLEEDKKSKSFSKDKSFKKGMKESKNFEMDERLNKLTKQMSSGKFNLFRRNR